MLTACFSVDLCSKVLDIKKLSKIMGHVDKSIIYYIKIYSVMGLIKYTMC